MMQTGGKIVKVNGVEGKTKNSDKPINGKVIVYIDGLRNMLVRPEKIKIIGFYD